MKKYTVFAALPTNCGVSNLTGPSGEPAHRELQRAADHP